MQRSNVANRTPVQAAELRARTQESSSPAGARGALKIADSIDAERFRLALMDSAIGLAITDSRGRFLSVNRAFCRIAGYTERELLARDWMSLTHPDDRKRSLALALRMRSNTRRSFSLEKRYITKSGDIVWCRASLSAVPGPPGHPTCHIALVEDITRRKQAEENVRRLNLELARRIAALETERKRWRWILQAIPDDVWICDLKGRSRLIKLPDPDPLRLRNLQGHSMAQMMRQLEIWHPDGRPLTLQEAPMLRSLRGETLKGELRVRTRAGGDTSWRQFASAPIRDDAGAILGAVSVTRDVTQQKQALERQQEYQKVMDGVAGMIVVVDRDYRYLIANRAFLEARGLAREQVIGHTVPELTGLPLFENTIKPKLDECFQGKVVKFELRYAFPRWGERDLAFSYFPVQGQHGIDRVACLVEDITERKQAEVDVRSLMAIAEKLNSTLEIDQLLDALLVEAMKLTGAEMGWAGERAPEGMVCRSHFRGLEKIPFEYTWPLGVGMPGWVLEHKVPYLSAQAARDPVILPELRRRLGVKSGLTVPILDAKREVLGFLAVINKKGGGLFTPVDVEKLTAVCQSASVALQHALAFQKLQRAEESLRRLSASLLRSQDDEHRRISRELHDSTSQNLGSLVLSLASLRKAGPRLDRQLRKNLATSLALAKESAREVRSLAYLLHPPMLDEFGLADALRWYARGFSQRSHIALRLRLPPKLGRFSREIETVLFRVVQEALNNVRRHSGSTRAVICLNLARNSVILEVRDFGHGMPEAGSPSLPSQAAAMGIAGMRERLQELGGKLQLYSSPRGTLVRAILPYVEGVK